MKLFEITRTTTRPPTNYLQPWMYKTKEEIWAWIERHNEEISEKLKNGQEVKDLNGFYIDDELEIHCVNDDIRIKPDSEIYYDLRKAYGKNPDMSSEEAHVDREYRISKGEKEKVAPHVLIRHGEDVLLPVQFKSTKSIDFQLPLTSLIGCPTFVYGNLRMSRLMITDLHGFPSMVTGEVRIHTYEPLSFEGFPSNFKHSKTGSFSSEIHFESNVHITNFQGFTGGIERLGVGSVKSFSGLKEATGLEYLLLDPDGKFGGLHYIVQAPDLITVTIDQYRTNTKIDPRLAAALKIVNEHVDEHDMIGCKKALVNAGLKEFI